MLEYLLYPIQKVKGENVWADIIVISLLLAS